MRVPSTPITGRNLFKLMINTERYTSIITEIRMDSSIEKNKLVTRPLRDIRIDQTSLFTEVSPTLLISWMTSQAVIRLLRIIILIKKSKSRK